MHRLYIYVFFFIFLNQKETQTDDCAVYQANTKCRVIKPPSVCRCRSSPWHCFLSRCFTCPTNLISHQVSSWLGALLGAPALLISTVRGHNSGGRGPSPGVEERRGNERETETETERESVEKIWIIDAAAANGKGLFHGDCLMPDSEL